MHADVYISTFEDEDEEEFYRAYIFKLFIMLNSSHFLELAQRSDPLHKCFLFNKLMSF